MNNLQISPGALINIIILITTVISFIFAYNKAVKNRVDKSDLTDLKTYVDQQDAAIDKRVDETNERINETSKEINQKLDLILSHLLSKKK